METVMDTLEKVLPRTIFLTVAGSHLYGTNIESSDYDFKGACVPTKDYFLGWLKTFERADAEELLSIRRGAWSYDRLIEEAERIDGECAELYKTSPIPNEPDRVWLDKFVIDLTDQYLST